MELRTSKKLAISALALGAASAAVVFGSWAAWTAQTANPGNSVSTGTLTLGNNKSATSVFSAATGAKPGDTGGSTVTVTNTGSTTLSSVSLTQGSVANTVDDTQNTMKLQIHDDTTNRCIWPTSAAGACASYGAWNAAGTLDGTFHVISSDADDAWGASEAHTFTVNWKFNDAGGADNTSQGKAASFDLTWNGVQ